MITLHEGLCASTDYINRTRREVQAFQEARNRLTRLERLIAHDSCQKFQIGWRTTKFGPCQEKIHAFDRSIPRFGMVHDLRDERIVIGTYRRTCEHPRINPRTVQMLPLHLLK